MNIVLIYLFNDNDSAYNTFMGLMYIHIKQQAVNLSHCRSDRNFKNYTFMIYLETALNMNSSLKTFPHICTQTETHTVAFA